VSLVFLLIVFVCVLRSLTTPWMICLYLFGVWILRSALLRSTTLNPVDYLEHLISKVNWVNFKINSVSYLILKLSSFKPVELVLTPAEPVLPSLFLVFVENIFACLFTPLLATFNDAILSRPRPTSERRCSSISPEANSG
jgi:hypothetical protein